MAKPLRKPDPPLPSTQLADVFAEMMELPSADRPAYLQQKEIDDPSLAERVKALGVDRKSLQKFLEGTLVPEGVSLGQELGGFIPKQLIGEGGFAKVYLAEDISLGRQVALKVSLLRGQEAKILALLEHDNIVKVHSTYDDHASGVHVICMQHIDGVNLSDVIKHLEGFKGSNGLGARVLQLLRSQEESPLEGMDLQEFTLWLGQQLAEALDYAHKKGVLHLDVKPSNILLNRQGRPFLTDFNVSLDSAACGPDGPIPLGGTHTYMPPEQLRALQAAEQRKTIEPVDSRADIYSLGVVLLALAGKKVGGNPLQQRVAEARGKNPAKVVEAMRMAGIDFGLARIIRRCVRWDPEDRFQSAHELADALASCLKSRRIVHQLPKAGFFVNFASDFPLFSFLSMMTFSQLFAVGITWLDVMETIRDFQRALPLIATVQAICMIVVGSLLHDSFRKRFRLVRFPEHYFLLMSLFWLPASIVTATAVLRTSLFSELGAQIVLDFVSLGLTSIGYTIVIVQWLLIRAIYPRFLFSSRGGEGQVNADLHSITGMLRPFYAMTVLGPALAAMGMPFSPTSPPVLAALFGALFSLYLRHKTATLCYGFVGHPATNN